MVLNILHIKYYSTKELFSCIVPTTHNTINTQIPLNGQQITTGNKLK